MRNEQWYKGMSFYQIWPRSFMDSNGDGIGDLYGIYEKLDYIQNLGVDGIWLSPLYVSPHVDYGYDVADYKNISPEFGDLEIFKKVLDGAHARGLKVIMDLVINHTSTEHEWFKKSIADPQGPYHDYYFWKKGRPGGLPPNNWVSLFGGDAWEYNEELDEYYLHLFAKTQADLNMDNPRVREELKDIMRFWLDMGIDGFREDVITYISKTPDLPSQYSTAAKRGIRYYNNGPKVHEYLREFKNDVLDRYDCMTIGEAPQVTPEIALTYIDEKDKVLDMVFHFQAMEADFLFDTFSPIPFSLTKLKRAFSRWQRELQGKAWNALFLENHDHPRVISRFGNTDFRVESGKMLAASYLFQQGTPFIYQGQEIGMTNISLESIDEYKDVATINAYQKLVEEPEEIKMALMHRASRDSARTPMQWSNAPHAGFTTGEPWFVVNPNYTEINVEQAESDENSLLNFYRKALKLRKETPVILWGDYTEHCPCSNLFYVYSREYQGARLLVICYFGAARKKFKSPPDFDLGQGTLILSNYDENPVEGNSFFTRPYETRVYLY